MKEKDPQHTLNNRRNNKVATRCRICGGKLYTPQDMKIEMHEECNKDIDLSANKLCKEKYTFGSFTASEPLNL